MPNACNQCHLDKSLAWTAEVLAGWYGQPPLDRPNEDSKLPHAAVGLLKGDAANRVLYAYVMGWKLAHVASGKGWQASLLAELLTDPYAAVRFVAQRSLKELPGYDDLDYDFIAAPDTLAKQQAQARQRARRHPKTLDTMPKLSSAQVKRLIEQRDTTPISISE
jgi:hypothetical protein